VTYSTLLLDALSTLAASEWEGVVYRHMFGSIPPERENQLGARWNPPEVPAMYCSLERQTAIAEGDFQIAAQPLRPKATRRVHRIQVSLTSVVQLTDWKVLEHLGVVQASFDSVEPPRCKEIGGALAYLGHDGILVPSARCSGINLIIYPTAGYSFKPLDFSVIP
jgi:RES domain-containing protein